VDEAAVRLGARCAVDLVYTPQVLVQDATSVTSTPKVRARRRRGRGPRAPARADALEVIPRARRQWR
jgi:hypothetical protein